MIDRWYGWAYGLKDNPEEQEASARSRFEQKYGYEPEKIQRLENSHGILLLLGPLEGGKWNENCLGPLFNGS